MTKSQQRTYFIGTLMCCAFPSACAFAFTGGLVAYTLAISSMGTDLESHLASTLLNLHAIHISAVVGGLAPMCLIGIAEARKLRDSLLPDADTRYSIQRHLYLRLIAGIVSLVIGIQVVVFAWRWFNHF